MGGSPKRKESLREKQADQVVEALSLGDVELGTGLNQEHGLGRPCELAPLLNFVGGSPKRKEFLREKQVDQVVEALSLGEVESGTGLNQECGLGRPCDTRWGSPFKTILNVLDLYPKILKSLDSITQVSDTVDSNKAQSITHLLMSFDFVFVAHLMVAIFGITNELNVALQKHERDIVNAMEMVDVTKFNLQNLRNG
ncbi:uncharacterized protein LOC110682693 [Chenopodium quinoa]|uniref:uncharacterized protein LOC110682693 n=1 Tax=Chenopodium quinoa TaxID=63459 RepID=UPI000B795C4C|nr:uncharacterized protein LOC110682693 [Chenopodium quinoa]